MLKQRGRKDAYSQRRDALAAPFLRQQYSAPAGTGKRMRSAKEKANSTRAVADASLGRRKMH